MTVPGQPPGVPPAPTGLGLTQEDRSLRVSWRGRELLRYVYRPWDPGVESPKPYFHPIRTIGGDLVSLYRPHDHVWHKGIAWSLSNVGAENFWGGPTYLRGREYVQLDNNGTMVHDGFDAVGVRDGLVRVDERLTWHTRSGRDVIAERRQFVVTALPDGVPDARTGAVPDVQAWQLAFATTMRNTSGATIPIGSPTTQGRENAGYSGLFWRGPRSFTGGLVVMPDAEGGDDLMGRRGPWLAFVGRHDGHGRASTVLMRDDPGNVGHPTRWFVRNGMYACVCPAPFFDHEYELADGASLTLRYDIVVADGALDATGAARLAHRAGTLDVTAAP